MSSSSSLTEIYKCCVASYILAIEEYGDETTGEIEKIALDGVFLILWAKAIGLHDGQIDAQLKYFYQYIEQELSRLNQSFGLNARTTNEPSGLVELRNRCVHSPTVFLPILTYCRLNYSKSHNLRRWMTDCLASYEQSGKNVISIAGGSITSNTFQTTSAQLSDLCTASNILRKALPRVLSESQKTILERAIKRYEGIILSEVNAISSSSSPELHLDSLAGRDPLTSLLELRIDTYAEERRIKALMLQRLEVQAMSLERAIGIDKPRPETVRPLSVRHVIGRYEGKLVFMEKRINHGWTAEGQKAIEIFLRIDKLASRLARGSKLAGLCTLDCVKYFSDRQDKEYTFVYSWPWELESWAPDQVPGPRTLHEFLQDIDEEESPPYSIGPSLTLRVEIAQRIAKCVEIFHLCGWLHKSISSHNVIIFPAAHQSVAASTSAKRFFLVGFEYSRPDGKNNITEPITTVGEDDIYRHPDATSFEGRSLTADSVFEKKHDLYALGLLLIEIALWQRLDSIIKSDYLCNPQLSEECQQITNLHSLTPRERHSWLVGPQGKPLEALLQFSIGEQYTGAVMACLREEISEGNDYGGDIYDKVIEPLTHCTV